MTDEKDLAQVPAIAAIDVSSIIAAVPEVWRKSMLGAVCRLIGSAASLAAGEVKNLELERAAASEQRRALIKAAGEQMSHAAVEPHLTVAAMQQASVRILGRQHNVDAVAFKTIDYLSRTEPELIPKSASKEVNPDWLNMLESVAENASSEGMRATFARILAGEIRAPGSFSAKAVRVMSELSEEVARDFQIFCSLAITLRYENGMIGVGRVLHSITHAGTRSAEAYGIRGEGLQQLVEYGLVAVPDSSADDFLHAIEQPGTAPVVPLWFQGAKWKIVPLDKSKYHYLPLRGLSFTRVGRELASIVTIDDTMEAHVHTVSKYLRDNFGMSLERGPSAMWH